MKTKLTDITDVVRSKNSGPYELTLDIMFKTFEDFEKVCAAKAINENLICDLYKITLLQYLFYQCYSFHELFQHHQYH